MTVYYQDEDLALYSGNCVDILNSLPAESVDLTVTSPPYDNLRVYNGFSFEFESVAQELLRVTKSGGVVVWVVADSTHRGSESGTSFRQALYFKDIGFSLHDTMIYEKSNYVPLTHNRYEQCFEFMFVFSKGRPNVFNPIMIPCKTAGTKNNHKSEKHYEESHSMRKRDADVLVKDTKIAPNKFVYTVGAGDKTKHNAPFPEQLAEDHILSWSNEGDVVLDPMCGSGTTLKMALKLNRKAIGIDISEDYCGMTLQRLGKVKDEVVA